MADGLWTLCVSLPAISHGSKSDLKDVARDWTKIDKPSAFHSTTDDGLSTLHFCHLGFVSHWLVQHDSTRRIGDKMAVSFHSLELFFNISSSVRLRTGKVVEQIEKRASHDCIDVPWFMNWLATTYSHFELATFFLEAQVLFTWVDPSNTQSRGTNLTVSFKSKPKFFGW